MPSSSIPVPDRDLGTSPSRKSSVDDLRRQNSKLKSDLEAERTKLRQVMRDKALESKRVQDNFEKEKQKAIELATKRLTTEHAAQLRKIRESIAKEKENELRQVLKFKDEEVKALKQHISEEREKNRAAEEELRRILVNKSKEGEDHTECERKLRSEIATLKEQKQKAEEMYRLKASAETEQMELIRRMKADHELELQKFIKDSKRESVQNLQHRRLTEKALEEKQHELAYKDQLARKLEAEKGDLQRRISLTGEFGRSSLTTSGSFDTNLEDSPLVKKDRERELKKKNAELQGKVENLERKCAVLEKENTKSGNFKATFIAEEKMKKLKKRNSELVSIARQLEDKAKKLQEEKVMAQKLAQDTNLTNAGVEHVKRMYARQRAKDLAEHAKTLLTKEKELEEVKKQLTQPQNSQTSRNDKVEELHSIIRQSAKERLWLERQMSSGEYSRTPSPQLLHEDITTEMGKRAEAIALVEAENKNLKASVSELKKVEAESLKLAEELKGKREENQKLVNDLKEKQTKCSKLELERERFAAKCTMLQKKNSEMGKRLKELEEVESKVVATNEKLQVAEQNNASLSSECKKLKSQLEELLQVKEDLKNMEKQKDKIEQEHLASVEKLKERQEEIRQLHKIQEEANSAHEMAVTSLEDTVRGLEQKCVDAEENNINLKKEVEDLREEERLRNRKREDLCHKSTQTMLESFSVMSPAVHKEEPGVKEKERSSINLKPSNVIRPITAADTVSVQPEARTEANSKKSTTTTEPIGKSDDILEGLSLRINELAASDSEDDTFNEQLHGETDNKEIGDDKSKKPETDLEALSRRIDQVAVNDDTSTSSSSISRERHGSQGSQDLTSMADGDLGDMEDNQPDSSAPEDEQTDHSDRPIGKLNSHDTEPSDHNKISAVVRNENTAEEGCVDSGYRGGDSDVDPAIHEKLAVYIARYSYDPVQHSPNESPEAELAFQAGDYLYVFGEMDEDGYYLGELMSGQRGLVPSNFVEKVADESDMNMMMNGTGEGIDDIADSSDEEETDGKLHRALRRSLEHIPDVALDDITEEEEGEEDDEELSLSEDEDNEDLSKGAVFSQDGMMSDTDLEPFRVPSPRRLVLERQFTRSVLLSWKPAELPADQVKGYGVYVDGELRLMMKGASKTKALLEDIDTDKTYRMSVRTITTSGEESWDRSAVVNVGRDASLAPSHVHITCVSPTSATVEWSPGNSSFSHEIIVNGTIDRAVRPGTFQHTLTNLEPDHAYKVLVRAKNPRQSLDYDNEADLQVDSLTAEAEFRTEPGGLPDPPLDVEVVEGDSNSLHVNWIPITITEKGTSNGARVTGYKVYSNGFPCTEVTSPTADCVTVVSWMVERAVKRSHSEVLCLVVRTQSCEGESTDSNEVKLPVKMFNFKVNELVKPKRVEPPRQNKEFSSSGEQSVNWVDSVSGQTDSVRRYSRDESGQAKVVIVDELPTSFNHGQGEHGSLPQPRTKGEPVVWKYDLSEDSENEVGQDSEIVDSAKKGEEKISSEDDEDEQVEICIQEVPGGSDNSTEPTADVNKVGYNPLEEENEGEADVPEAEQHVVEPKEGRDEPADATQSTGKVATVKPQMRRKDSDQSVVSDIDMEEFERSLDEAEVIPRRKHDEEESEDKKPFIRPLEYEESDFEDESSEQTPLSIIQEEDEEDLTESQALVSRVSQSHSASEGFLSDDDVMDLLDEDHVGQKSSSYSVDIGSVRHISQNEGPSTWDMERPEGVVSGGDDLGLAKYLAKSQDDPKSDISVESQDHLLDNIELEECDGEGVKSEEKDTTYSDTEADRGEVERSLTPIDNQEDTTNPESYAAVGGQPSNDHMNNSGELVSDEPMRVFMAVYDYDPATMSPNPDAEEEELAFKEGDLIKVYGDKDEDGFYWGELDGRTGFIPYNMVSEVQLEEEESGSAVTSPSLNFTQDSIQSLEQSLQSQTHPEDETDGIILEEEGYEDPRFSANYQLPPRRMVALFDYDPKTLSPNPDSEVELRFRVGDVIMVYGDMDEDGFYSGELRGVRGLVPSNFLEDLSETLEPVSQDTSHESSLDSSPEKLNTPNGNHVMVEADTPKKKKGIFSKGKQMFKKIAKGHNSPRASGSKR